MRVWIIVLAGLLSGCSHVVPGRQLSRLPPNMKWCSPQPLHIESRGPTEQAQTNELIPPRLFDHCTRKLMLYDRAPPELSSGTVSFGLTTDARGQVVDVCVWGGNMGDPLSWLECVDSVLKTTKLVLHPELNKQQWDLTFVLD